MKTSTLLFPCRIAVAAVGLLLATLPARAAFTMSQTFNLRAGWNAIWLEVEPVN